MSTTPRSLLFVILAALAAGCAAAPAEGSWDLGEVEWEGDCDDMVLGLAPIFDFDDVDVTETDEGIVLDNGIEVISCVPVDGLYVCDPVVVFDLSQEDPEVAEESGLNIVVTASYELSFSGSHRGTFDVELVGVCEGESCAAVEAMMAGTGLDFVCSSQGTQWAGLRR